MSSCSYYTCTTRYPIMDQPTVPVVHKGTTGTSVTVYRGDVVFTPPGFGVRWLTSAKSYI